jgi:hypothetical protein
MNIYLLFILFLLISRDEISSTLILLFSFSLDYMKCLLKECDTIASLFFRGLLFSHAFLPDRILDHISMRFNISDMSDPSYNHLPAVLLKQVARSRTVFQPFQSLLIIT